MYESSSCRTGHTPSTLMTFHIFTCSAFFFIPCTRVVVHLD